MQRDLAKDRALCAAATPEPWEVDELFIHCDIPFDDAQFAAEARTALPYWMDQYEEVKKENEKLFGIGNFARAEIEQLQQENERLKQRVRLLSQELVNAADTIHHLEMDQPNEMWEIDAVERWHEMAKDRIFQIEEALKGE